jgi:hypothetical protein
LFDFSLQSRWREAKQIRDWREKCAMSHRNVTAPAERSSGQHSGCPLVVQRRKGFKQHDSSFGLRPVNSSRSSQDGYRPTRSNIILAKLTLSLTTAVSLGEGRLMSGSRARRTAAMIAAAMTTVDFIRV